MSIRFLLCHFTIAGGASDPITVLLYAEFPKARVLNLSTQVPP